MRNPESSPMAEQDKASVVSTVPKVDRYAAIGDSITFGEKLSFTVDKRGHPQKTATSFQGWPAVLGQMLAVSTGVQTEVVNKGHPGDRVDKIRAQRFSDLFDSRNRERTVLLLIGTNDSNEFNPTNSGLGCSGFACEGTYNGKMRSVIQRLGKAGHEKIYLGLLPPVWGTNRDEPYADPLDLEVATRNARIVEYNKVIAEELLSLPGVEPGPDLFSCFLTPTSNRFSLFEDALHPNKLGYMFMAALWRDTLINGSLVAPGEPCPAPIYILESLDWYAHGHRQNLLETGDRYYTDEDFVLTNIPDELVDGIWVLQANAHRQNTDPEFLSFDAGSSRVSVYIAYDPAAEAPVSPTHEFLPATLSSDLTTSDATVARMAIVRASNVSGRVTIGGTRSSGGDASQQGYVAIVVP